jgi:hypothetical protein
MLTRLRKRCMAYRALWVALLMLALVWQPALLAASEVHESEHLIQTGHAHDADHEGPGIPADELSLPGDDGIWHSLMHLGHCCAQVSALPSGGAPMPLMLRPASTPDSPSLAIQSLTLPRPLRPPIQG